MDLITIIGLATAFLFFFKLAIHIYIKRSTDKKFHLGAFGQYTNPILFFPIGGEVRKSLKFAKTIGNCAYFISLILFLIFLVGINW